MYLERIVAVEAISLAAVIWKKHDSDVTLPTPRLAVASFGKSTQIRMDLRWNRTRPPRRWPPGHGAAGLYKNVVRRRGKDRTTAV